MKFISIILLCSFLVFSFVGCTYTPEASQAEIDASDESDIEYIRPERDEIIEKYTFLKSKYSVTAKSESQSIKYTYDYYFVDGVVGGMRQKVSFPDPESARNYYTGIVDDCPEAIINASTVTYFVGDNAYCYGYSLDKLKFQLEKVGYEYTINFIEEDFSEKFEASKTKNVTP